MFVTFCLSRKDSQVTKRHKEELENGPPPRVPSRFSLVQNEYKADETRDKERTIALVEILMIVTTMQILLVR